MKKVFCKLVIGLAILLSLSVAAQAESSFSVPISCIIPAVPGVNAPLNEGEAQPTGQNAGITESGSQEEKSIPTMIQEDSAGETVLVKGETTSIIIQTIYPR
jgi:hypothetical protein